MDRLDTLVIDALKGELLQPDRPGNVLSAVIDARKARAEEVEGRIKRLQQARFDARDRLRRLLDLVESSDVVDDYIKERIALR
jgi:hypothetical protein